jgi:hypothetical protein
MKCETCKGITRERRVLDGRTNKFYCAKCYQQAIWKGMKQRKLQRLVHTLLAHEEFCKKMAIHHCALYNDGLGDFTIDEKNFKDVPDKAEWIQDAKQALRNAAGMKEEKS